MVIPVDITLPGTYGPDTLLPVPPGLVVFIPAGTLVDSHYIHVDKMGSTGSVILTGSATFDTDILGVIVRVGRLAVTNPQLGAPGTAYGGTNGTDTQDGNPSCFAFDQVTVSSDLRTVTVCSATGPAADDVRVITRGRTPVAIDIKPGSSTNPINTASQGRVPVAILAGTGIDLTQVDISTVTLGGAAAMNASFEDVSGDGEVDLVLHFDTQATGLQPGDTQTCVKGELYDSTPFKGCDSVRVR